MDLEWRIINIESNLEFLTIILFIALVLIIAGIAIFGSLITELLESIRNILSDKDYENESSDRKVTSVDSTHLIEAQQKLIDKLSDDSLDEDSRKQIYYEIKAVQKVIDYISK